jgi:hypothetical protein
MEADEVPPRNDSTLRNRVGFEQIQPSSTGVVFSNLLPEPESHEPGELDNRPQFSRNMLFRNRGDGTYAEIAQFSGLEATEWSWMPIFLDVDLDGYEDVLVPNGFERDSMNRDHEPGRRHGSSSSSSSSSSSILLIRGRGRGRKPG